MATQLLCYFIDWLLEIFQLIYDVVELENLCQHLIYMLVLHTVGTAMSSKLASSGLLCWHSPMCKRMNTHYTCCKSPFFFTRLRDRGKGKVAFLQLFYHWTKTLRDRGRKRWFFFRLFVLDRRERERKMWLFFRAQSSTACSLFSSCVRSSIRRE